MTKRFCWRTNLPQVSLGWSQINSLAVIIADLVKPAYRALFRKTIAKRLAGGDAPNRIEVQLINGNQTGLWVEAQSSTIEFHGRACDPYRGARRQSPQESGSVVVA